MTYMYVKCGSNDGICDKRENIVGKRENAVNHNVFKSRDYMEKV